jgi:hypothetical protein
MQHVCAYQRTVKVNNKWNRSQTGTFAAGMGRPAAYSVAIRQGVGRNDR